MPALMPGPIRANVVIGKVDAGDVGANSHREPSRGRRYFVASTAASHFKAEPADLGSRGRPSTLVPALA
jgi:hypothetical protein